MTTRDRVLAYSAAIEQRAPFEQIAAFLHADVRVIEHPNKLTPAGKIYDLAALRAANERGRALLVAERYAVRDVLVDGNRAVVQSTWTGTLADDRSITAEICSVFELAGGAIIKQEQYCFA
ncbi:MAG TPA: nuclear transport factor 2 family protein [Kofleriaceae bacterium]|jgi:ketosteroid isomerase-like protein